MTTATENEINPNSSRKMIQQENNNKKKDNQKRKSTRSKLRNIMIAKI